MTPEAETGGNAEEESSAAMSAPAQPESQEAPMPEPATTEQVAPQVEGRRTQLKIVREGLDSLTTDVWNFRRSHEGSMKKIQADLKSVRKDLAAHSNSKELGAHAKSTEANNKRLEKQVASLRAELAALKTSMVKEAAKSRAREEASFSKLLAKVSAKPKTAKKPSKKK